ncbi:hypothetical protein CR983_00190 [Candidatus Saccharibacteria bacterium]|nr:MAG: hypothetical protein CR983_00190 [Candidatus Saccharibacteria bacterium]
MNITRMRRTRLLAVLLLGIMAVFVVRLFYLQVIQHSYYTALADQEQIRHWTLPAKRGEIYALDGTLPVKLAMNEVAYTAWVNPSGITEPGRIISVMERVAGGNVVDSFRQLLDKTDSRYQVIAKRLSHTQAQMIKRENIAGLGFTRADQRVYPEGQLASQVLGFVNGEQQGQYGIEAYFDDELRGRDGLLRTVADVRNVPLTIGNDNINQPAQHGKNIVLTIDRNIQYQAERFLSEGMKDLGVRYGSMIVIDPRTGAVKAMANMPTYDPSHYGDVDDLGVFNNNIISRPYEPASVIKTLTMSTGIDKGVMSPSSTYVNTDAVRVDDITIVNASKGQTGKIDMQRVLTWSLNTGTVTMAKWLGGGSINRGARDTMYQYFHDRFRLGQRSGIELANEAPGIVIPPTDPEGNAARYANMTFGQGMDVTPLQVATAFSAVVNGGVYRKPTIVAGEVDADGKFIAAESNASQQIIKQSTSSTMRVMTQRARQEFYAKQDLKGYTIGGKTGTAQTIEDGKYVFSTTEGTYIGYGAEKGKLPAYVILVTFASPGKNIGGEMANPTFTKMSNWLIDYLKLQSKG